MVSPRRQLPARPKNQFQVLLCTVAKSVLNQRGVNRELQGDAMGYLSRNDIEESGAARKNLVWGLLSFPMD